MALYWDFKDDFIGYAYVDEPCGYIYTVNLYTCNGLILALAETEEKYTLKWFFSDSENMIKCLKDGIFDYTSIEWHFHSNSNYQARKISTVVRNLLEFGNKREFTYDYTRIVMHSEKLERRFD